MLSNYENIKDIPGSFVPLADSQRLDSHIRPGSIFMKTLEERLELYTMPEPNTGCWLWTAWANNKGYGMINVNGKLVLVHRLNYEINHGKIPKGLCACHICDNTYCVNPDHIFIGTHKQNMHDMHRKARNVVSYKSINVGSNHPRSKLTEDDVMFIRSETKMTSKQLAVMFNVRSTYISDIKNRRTWKHLK